MAELTWQEQDKLDRELRAEQLAAAKAAQLAKYEAEGPLSGPTGKSSFQKARESKRRQEALLAQMDAELIPFLEAEAKGKTSGLSKTRVDDKLAEFGE